MANAIEYALMAVQAMAPLTMPALGQMTLSAANWVILAPVLESCWG